MWSLYNQKNGISAPVLTKVIARCEKLGQKPQHPARSDSNSSSGADSGGAVRPSPPMNAAQWKRRSIKGAACGEGGGNREACAGHP